MPKRPLVSKGIHEFVFGGSVGSAALQIANQRQCWVVATASRDDELQRAKESGANLLINCTKSAWSRDRVLGWC